jgi:multidrug efflux pump subunit AcrA (membrane-fusion protein)
MKKENQQYVKQEKMGIFIFGGKILLLLALFAVFSGCGGSGKLELAGTLERRTLEVSAPISEIIVDLPAAELRAHEAAYSAAKALLKEAANEFSRQEKLRRANVSSYQTYDTAKRKMDEALSLVAEKEARIAQAKKRLEDLTIRSRARGVVDQLPYEAGERVPAGGVVAVVIADDKPWVRVWLPARAVTQVSIGQEAKVKVEGLAPWFDAKVEHVSREAEFTPHYALTERESAHLVYETRVRLTDPKREMYPGIPARVLIPLQ